MSSSENLRPSYKDYCEGLNELSLSHIKNFEQMDLWEALNNVSYAETIIIIIKQCINLKR